MGVIHWSLFLLGVGIGVAYALPGGLSIKFGSASMWFGAFIVALTFVVSMQIGSDKTKEVKTDVKPAS